MARRIRPGGADRQQRIGDGSQYDDPSREQIGGHRPADKAVGNIHGVVRSRSVVSSGAASALPEVDFPTIQVTASFLGASPETMASTVATPLERQFAQIPGVTQMTSSSGLGNTSIVLQFDLNRNIDGAAQDVQTAIDAAAGVLPKNLPTPPTFRKVNPADSPILNLFVQSDDYPLTVVDDFTDTILSQQISQIPGIAQVNIDGEQKPSVRVEIDPAKIASLGLSLEDVRAMLATATVDSPKGYFDGPKQSFAIYDNDQLLHAAPYNDLILACRNGSPIKVRDIGVAVDAAENNKISAWHYGKQGVLLVVFKQPNANIVQTVDAVRRALPRLQAALPPGIDVSVLIDRTGPIRASIADVKFTMLLTIVLVIGVIFLFLRDLWATAIPAVTVPLSIIGTLALMYALGYSIDNLSLSPQAVQADAEDVALVVNRCRFVLIDGTIICTKSHAVR